MIGIFATPSKCSPYSHEAVERYNTFSDYTETKLQRNIRQMNIISYVTLCYGMKTLLCCLPELVTKSLPQHLHSEPSPAVSWRTPELSSSIPSVQL